VKRVTLVLAGLLCAAALTAQNRPPRTQTGNATQEMQTLGLSAAHNSLPIGSKATIRNLSNGREIEVTITEQIPPSSRRIIDISPAAALALELNLEGPVIVTPLGPLQGPPSPPQTPAIAEAEPEPAVEPEPIAAPVPIPEPEPVLPYTIIINNYIVSYEEMERLKKEGSLAPNSAVESSPESVNPSVSYSLFTAPPVKNVKILPALPSPHSGKTYRLLVGTFSGADGAFPVFCQLQAAGFEAVQEQTGSTCRVFAAGIPAASVYYAAQRLGAMGFEQVWVHE